MKPASTESAELQALRDALLACSPRRAASPPDPDRQIQEIEHRSRLTTVRRRWFAAGAAVSMAALAAALGLAWHRRPATPLASRTPTSVERAEQRYSTAETEAFVDLGPEVGRILLRPRTRTAYAARTRTLSLQAGRIVAHILPRGRGFSVRFGERVVIVKGTLFGVDAERGEVRVWHGVVEQRLGARRARLLHGTEDYGDLSRRDLSWLAFTLPRGLRAKPATPADSPPPQRPKRAPRPAAQNGGAPYHPDPMRRELLAAQQDLAAGRAGAALERLEHYEARYPASPLLEEACLLKLRALVQLGRFRRLQQLSYMFLRRYPGSAKRGEVELLQRRVEARLKQAGSR